MSRRRSRSASTWTPAGDHRLRFRRRQVPGTERAGGQAASHQLGPLGHRHRPGPLPPAWRG
eukprot:5726722-Alexandrium_andersonii.AAC.1